MLVVKSFFLSEIERFKLEELILSTNKSVSEADLHKLDDRELKELADKCRK